MYSNNINRMTEKIVYEDIYKEYENTYLGVRFNNYESNDFGWCSYGVKEKKRTNDLLNEIKENCYEVIEKEIMEFSGDINGDKLNMRRCSICMEEDLCNDNNFISSRDIRYKSLFCKGCINSSGGGFELICMDCFNNKEYEKWRYMVNDKVGKCCFRCCNKNIRCYNCECYKKIICNMEISCENMCELNETIEYINYSKNKRKCKKYKMCFECLKYRKPGKYFVGGENMGEKYVYEDFRTRKGELFGKIKEVVEGVRVEENEFDKLYDKLKRNKMIECDSFYNKYKNKWGLLVDYDSYRNGLLSCDLYYGMYGLTRININD